MRQLRPRYLRCLHAILVAVGLLPLGSLQAQAINPPSGAQAAHDVYLEVDVNDQPTSIIAHFHEMNGHLSATGKELKDLGFAVDRLGIADGAEVPLDSISGLHYQYDAANQVIDLHMADKIRTPKILDARSLGNTPPATSSRGLIVNYDAYAQTNTSDQLAVWSEARYFDPNGTFSNTGIAYLYVNQHRYMRYDTSFSFSNPAELSTTQIGDFISSSLAWSRSIRIGGFQWRSNFALRPDLVTFPIPSLGGSAVVPSAVDLYINNVRQFSENVPSGPFILNNVPGITGAGQATVITRDALGRAVSTSVPIYIDTRLLDAGLSSKSIELGFLRRSYGIESFDYDPHPAMSGSIRYGVSNALTVEAHGEASNGLINVGAGGLIKLGLAGVVNGSLSASAGRLPGSQMSLGYELIEPRFSIDAQTIRAFSNYGDLAARDGTPVAAATDTVTLGLPLFGSQTLALSYIGSRYPQQPSSAIASVSYSLNLSRLISLNLNAYRDFKQHNSHGLFLSLSVGFGHNISVNASAGRQNGLFNDNLNLVRPADYDGGWGWGVQTENSGATSYRQAQVQYLGRDGEATLVEQDIANHTSTSLDVSGAVVLMDKSIQLSRRIDDGFALVSTDGVAGIPVLHENRVIGLTDQSGHLLIPDLNSYQDNQLAIDGMKLRADVRIATTHMDVVPQALSGVLAHFGVTLYNAASVILVDPNGAVLPPGTRVHHQESGMETVVGYDGLTFIEGLQQDNHLVIDSDTLHCTANFGYIHPQNGSLPTFGPLTCLTQPGGAP